MGVRAAGARSPANAGVRPPCFLEGSEWVCGDIRFFLKAFQGEEYSSSVNGSLLPQNT